MDHKYKILFFLLGISLYSTAQPYAPSAGQLGTTAMYKDSSVFISWASDCFVTRGYQDISDPSLGLASAGDATMATGVALANGVVSLGDGGSAVCSFPYPVMNGPGPDFAVFENSFNDQFLELAFVEVSSDGVHFERFPSHSLTDTTVQTDGFGSTDATKLNNLAGKYRGGYGTPFDLQELSGKPGLDISRITHIRIVDVVGSMNTAYASRDSYGRKINDPWQTPYPSSGFDLDAIGVIHQNIVAGIGELSLDDKIRIWPNPSKNAELIQIEAPFFRYAELLDVNGKMLLMTTDPRFSAESFEPGVYFLRIQCDKGGSTKRLVIF